MCSPARQLRKFRFTVEILIISLDLYIILKVRRSQVLTLFLCIIFVTPEGCHDEEMGQNEQLHPSNATVSII